MMHYGVTLADEFWWDQQVRSIWQRCIPDQSWKDRHRRYSENWPLPPGARPNWKRGIWQ